METVCSKCGLPKNLCVCQEMAKEEQKVKIRINKRRFGKVVTVVSGLGGSADAGAIFKELKRKLACGGTTKGNEIALQGNHKNKVKEFLLSKGFKEELIDA